MSENALTPAQKSYLEAAAFHSLELGHKAPSASRRCIRELVRMGLLEFDASHHTSFVYHLTNEGAALLRSHNRLSRPAN